MREALRLALNDENEAVEYLMGIRTGVVFDDEAADELMFDGGEAMRQDESCDDEQSMPVGHLYQLEEEVMNPIRWNIGFGEDDPLRRCIKVRGGDNGIALVMDSPKAATAMCEANTQHSDENFGRFCALSLMSAVEKMTSSNEVYTSWTSDQVQSECCCAAEGERRCIPCARRCATDT